MPLGPRPFIPCPGTVQLNAYYKCAGQECQNVFHFNNGGSAEWTDAELTLLKGMYDAWESAYGKALRSTNTSLDRVRIVDLTVADGRVLDQASSIEGTHSGVLAAQSNTFALKANTGRSGRSRRGRTYLIGMPEDSYTQGVVEGGYRNGCITAMNALIAAAETNGTPLGVLSFVHANAWRSEGLFTIIQDYSVTDDSVDSQRRRLPNH